MTWLVVVTMNGLVGALDPLTSQARPVRFYLTLVPVRPRRRGERRSLRTLPGDSLRPHLAHNPRPRRLSTPTDAFQLHPDVRFARTVGGSQAHGANDFDAVKKHLRSGVRAGVLPRRVRGRARSSWRTRSSRCAGCRRCTRRRRRGYCQIEAWGMLPVVLFQTFRLSLSGTNLFAPLVYAIVLSNVANVAMNDVLIFGSEGVLGSMLTPFLGGGVIPAMGLDGAAWATTASRWILLASLLLFARKPLAKRDAFRGPLHRRGDVASAATLIAAGLADRRADVARVWRVRDDADLRRSVRHDGSRGTRDHSGAFYFHTGPHTTAVCAVHAVP